MTVRGYLKDRIGFVAAVVCIMVVFKLLGFACKARMDFIWVMEGIIFVTSLCAFGADYRKRSRFYRELQGILDGLDQKYLITEMMVQPDFEEGKIWMDVLYDTGKSMRDKLNDTEDSLRDFKEYLELWIHEIKIPIAALNLMNYNGSQDLKKQKAQLARINGFVEQILFYARADAAEKDYLLTACNLDAAINQVLQQQKDLLIGNKIRIEKNDTDHSVVTDSKWLAFMLGQIVNNSIKYRDTAKQSCISFAVEDMADKTVLRIRDNGIGITQQDIDRVFDKTFTGENGRRGNASTGMGLYICKQLCNKLGHSIAITSVYGEYTEVEIVFGKETFLTRE